MIRRRALLAAMGGAALLGGALPARADDLSGVFDDLLYGDDRAFAAAMTHLRARGGLDLIAPLIFGTRFRPHEDAPMFALMQDLTGERDRASWFDWMLWQEQHPEVTPHPDYIGMKRKLYLRIDPNFDVYLTSDRIAAMSIRFEEMTWGGARKDAIPSLDNPPMIPAAEADYLVGSDFVFGVAINGDIRAYPLRILGWHEMFNDVVGGVPVALAYCTLCGSGILFETEVPGHDAPLVFGTSGFLYRSNKLMFDRQTDSLWNQFTGKPVSGPLVSSGIELRQRPVVIEPWVRWVARHPETKVLSLDTGHRRNYGSGVVYDKYFRSPDLMFPAMADQTLLHQKDYIFGIRTFGAAKAWPVAAFEGGQVINDRVGDLNVVLIGDRLGRTVRAYDRQSVSFEAGESAEKVTADGQSWTVGEEFLTGPNGEKAPRVAGHVAYWFAWNNYMGAQSELYQ
ncbi:MAG: DUF3179 domain-containing protein [Pseudomonadota bacterium]